ncbi:Panacea domain-containing protein [Aminobacter sp. HY435]|uniref:Panacea domain-containing protein n=1 Tax=Aminobacter sp. HY435 TaxID=2970917 RepID=UPI0022B9943D|nr:Panacea domain-containing protein [Aminobacter sp. HY435]
MLLAGFDVSKAAEAVAYLALKSGGSINVLKLSKLVYLAEREFMARYDEPMFYDTLVSMPDGPVASITLNLINGNLEDERWSKFVAKRDSFDIKVVAGTKPEGLKHLSKADVKVLEALWEKFGKLDKYALRDWTHKKENLPEWQDPNGSSRPIHHEDVFRYLKKDDSLSLSEEVHEYRRLHQYLNAAK